jgi:hypothetical protein
MLALGKEHWHFKDLEDQINMYHQQWQADQQNQIIVKMSGKCKVSQTMANAKIVREILTKTMVVEAAVSRAIIVEEVMEEAAEAAVEDSIITATI